MAREPGDAVSLATAAPDSTLPLALLGAEVAALVGPERDAPSRVARAIGYRSATLTGVMRGEDRPSAVLLELLADELGAGPHALARWEAWRVASLPRRLPWRLPKHVAPVLPGASPLRSHRMRWRERRAAEGRAARRSARCAWCSLGGPREDFEPDGEGGHRCAEGSGCAVARDDRRAA